MNGDGSLDVFMTGEDPNDETRTLANLYINYSDQKEAADFGDDDDFDDGFDDGFDDNGDYEPFNWTTNLLIGEWRVLPFEGSLVVGPNPYELTPNLEDNWWWLGQDGDMRECYTDDIYTFGADGSFSIDFQEDTWIENWQSGDTTSTGYCGNPSDANGIGINPDGEFYYQATLPSEEGLYNVTDAKLSVAGVGAYIGLPKAYNGGEMADLAGNLLIDPNTITERTYTYRMLDENTLMVSMDWGEGYWITFLGRVGMSGAAGESVARMDPYEAFSDEPVTIYFDLNLGNQRLAGYQGDIYVHTGVQTNLNDLEAEFPYDFSYQIGEYGDNDVNPKLEMVAENYYKLDIPTSIREFYGVPDDEEIYNLVFVLRSQDTFRAEDGAEFFIMQGEYDGAAILVGVNTEDDRDDFGGRLNLSGVQNIKTIYLSLIHISEPTRPY